MYTEKDEYNGERTGQQLVLNYCYGHKDSSLLLFSYSPVVNFINHNRNPNNVNSRIQWSKISNKSKAWTHKPVNKLLLQQDAKLMMEFIALRNIRKGEEIYIEYGIEWQQAWDNHVRHWKSLRNNNDINYVSVDRINSVEAFLRTEMEQRQNPYSENLFMKCHISRDLDLLN